MYAGPGPNIGPPPTRPKKERKVSIVFRHLESDHKHCSGVESVLLVPGHKILFSASRDSTIKRWNVGGPAPWFEASFEGHADWVNDITLVNDVLVSCSNDKTVRFWRGTSQGMLLSTLTHHSDYVTCLAASPARNVVATAGLRGEVFLIDLATAANIRLYPKDKQVDAPGPSQRQRGPDSLDRDDRPSGLGLLGGGGPNSNSNSNAKGSIYALAMNTAGTLLAAGGADHLLRLWDPRTCGKVAKLRSHTDYVRCLAVSGDGTHVLSGASDGTVKLWDVGMQRCVQTYKVHSDSVWSLLPSEDFAHVYSGGRDRCVYRTNLASRTAELMLVEQRPICSMALDSSEGSLWVSTESSSISKWQLSADGQAPRIKAFPVFDRVSLRMRQSHEARRSIEPQVPKPVAVVEGVPAIVQHKVLNDRRHILTRNSEGEVELWDILTGGVVQAFGKVDMAAQERALFEPISVPSWFSMDVRLGQPCITLEPPGCFFAEEYALALGVPDVAEDVKVNYGKLVLDGAFAKWRRRVLLMDQQQQQQQLQAVSLPGSPAAPLPPAGAAAGPVALGAGPGPGAAQGAGPGVASAADDGPLYGEMWPKYWEPGTLPPAVICSTTADMPWRLLATQFTGNEGDPDELPSWVVDAVLRGANVVPKEAKLAFILLPAEGSEMPSLMQSKLNAPRILQIHKVASYCMSKLQELNIHLDMRPQYLRRPPHAPPEEPPEGPSGRPALELLCNGMGVPYEMSLASVKKFIWRKSDDLVFHFRVRDPNNPVPLPVIQPPSH